MKRKGFKKMKVTKPLTTVDIFSAPGGLSLGFSMAGFNPLIAVDFDKYGVETLIHNFSKTKVISADLRNLNGKEFLEKMIGDLGPINVLCGGPPCQGFSNIGRVKIASLVREGIWKLNNSHSRMIDDPRNLLYKEFVRLLNISKPLFFVMENVNGLASYFESFPLADGIPSECW